MKQKCERLWKDGMWKVDKECGCHCCTWWYTGVGNEECCQAPGRRFKDGFCMRFEKIPENEELSAQEKYDRFVEIWN